MDTLMIVDGAARGFMYSVPNFLRLAWDLTQVAFSHKLAFLICCRPCWFITLPLPLPLHQYLFSLPGPDRWECSGIKASVFTILFTSISASPFGHGSLRKKHLIFLYLLLPLFLLLGLPGPFRIYVGQLSCWSHLVA